MARDVIPAEVQEVRELLGVYASSGEYKLTARARMRAAYRAGRIMERLNSSMRASKRRIAEMVGMEGIDEEFVRQLIVIVRDLGEEEFLDKVSALQITTVDGFYRHEYLASYQGTPDDGGEGSYSIIVRELRLLGTRLTKMKTYDRALSQLRQIHRLLLGMMPALAMESVARDPWFFSMQPCVVCGEYPDIGLYPTGYTLDTVQIGHDRCIVPRCDDCRDRNGKVQRRYVLRLYVRYALLLEREIMNKEVEHFGRLIDLTDEEEELFGDVL